LFSGEQIGDGQDLKPRTFFGEILGLIETCRSSLGEDWSGGLSQSDQRADGGLLAFDHAYQVTHVIYAHVADLHLHHHFLRGAAVIVDEINVAVQARARAILAVARWTRAHQIHRPPTVLKPNTRPRHVA